MAPPGSFFARVFQWLANEVIVKSLANSPAFQQFAVRTSAQAREATRQAAEAARALAESAPVVQLRNEGEAARERALGLANALREEVEEMARRARDELQGGGGQKPPPRPP
jgi:exonuclease VII large subunit